MYAVRAASQSHTHALEEYLELLYLFECGLFVYPVYEGNLQPEKMLCDGLIGQQHEFFYQLVCRTAFCSIDAYRYAFIVESDVSLVEIEIEASSL